MASHPPTSLGQGCPVLKCPLILGSPIPETQRENPVTLTLSTKQLATATGSLLQLSRSLRSWLGEGREIIRPPPQTPCPPPQTQNMAILGVMLWVMASTRSKPCPREYHIKYSEHRKKPESHMLMLDKRQRKTEHQHPPWEGTQLLCKQESNTQKQRLKEEKERKPAKTTPRWQEAATGGDSVL